MTLQKLRRCCFLLHQQVERVLVGIPSLGGGIVDKGAFFDPSTGLKGTQYNITLAYTTGDLASLALVTSGLSGVGVNTTVSEVTSA